MPTKVVIGTSLFQIIFVTAFTTVMHAVTSQTVDMMLALLLILGGVVGAQIGTRVGVRLKAEQLRILLSLLVLAVSIRIAARPSGHPGRALFGCAGGTAMIRALALLMALALPAAAQEQIVAGMSQNRVSITADFDGSEILIYGAVKRDTPPPTGAPLEVIVTVEGPSTPVSVRRKGRVAGIWVNTDSGLGRQRAQLLCRGHDRAR